MKLNISSKELLALHNLLYERYADPRKAYEEDHPRASDDTQLRQVYNRLRACLIAGLTNKQVDPFDAFMSREQAKIDKLKDQNEEIKLGQTELAQLLKEEMMVPDDGEDFAAPEYPRRGPRNRNGNRGGQKR